MTLRLFVNYSGTSYTGQPVCQTQNSLIHPQATSMQSNSHTGCPFGQYVSLTIHMSYTLAVSRNGHVSPVGTNVIVIFWSSKSLIQVSYQVLPIATKNSFNTQYYKTYSGLIYSTFWSKPSLANASYSKIWHKLRQNKLSNVWTWIKT